MTTYRKSMAEALKDVYLGENNLEKMRKASKGAAQTLKMKDGNLKMDSFTASAIMQIYDKINDKNKKTFEKMMKDGKKADIMKLQKFAMSKISSEYVPEEFEEEVELDEAKYTRKLMKDKSVVDYVKSQQEKNRKRGNTPQDGAVYHGANWVDIAADAIGMNKMSLSKKKAFDWDSEYEAVAKKLGEEVELDEKLDKEDEPTIKKVVKMLKKASGAHAGQAKDLEKAMTEEDEIDEGKMSQLHQLMKDGKSAKEIAKIMKLDVKTIQALMDEKSELEEKRHRDVDPADIDTSATADDIKAADKNIMMQLRKSVSLRGQFPVEFLDKKKVKVPQKIALAVIAKYNGLRKPMDKEKFQAKIAKSHRDLLMGLKEGFASDAQRRAAFARGYKAKGKKDKKESTLERMNNKIQEKKNG